MTSLSVEGMIMDRLVLYFEWHCEQGVQELA
jgi:hypothetical protein